MGRKDRIENGVIDDSERIDYVKDHLRWVLRAIEIGVNVEGYFMWSLQDQFSWTNGYSKRYGFFYVDFEASSASRKRVPIGLSAFQKPAGSKSSARHMR